MKTIIVPRNQQQEDLFSFTTNGCQVAREYLENFHGYTSKILNKYSGYRIVLIARRKLKNAMKVTV